MNNFEISLSFRVRQNTQTKRVQRRSRKITSHSRLKNINLEVAKLTFYPKRLVFGFVENVLDPFFFGKIGKKSI